MLSGEQKTRRFEAALLGALALHVVGLAIGPEEPLPSRPSVSPPEDDGDLIELSLVTPARKPATPASLETSVKPESKPSTGVSARVSPSSTAMTDSQVVVVAGSDAAEEPAFGEVETTVEEGARESRERHKPINLGLDGSLAYQMIDRSPRRANLPSSQRDVGGLKRGLLESDVQQGLGRGGVVAQLSRNVTLKLGPSGESSATLSFTFGRTGAVTSVRLVEASSATMDWDQVANALEQHLKTNPVKNLPESGYRVVVRIEAKDRLPSGAKKPVKGRGKDIGIVFQFDVADIGRGTVRTVNARVVSEETL